MKPVPVKPNIETLVNSIIIGYTNHANATRKVLTEGYASPELSASAEEIKTALGENLGDVETITALILEDKKDAVAN